MAAAEEPKRTSAAGCGDGSTKEACGARTVVCTSASASATSVQPSATPPHDGGGSEVFSSASGDVQADSAGELAALVERLVEGWRVDLLDMTPVEHDVRERLAGVTTSGDVDATLGELYGEARALDGEGRRASRAFAR